MEFEIGRMLLEAGASIEKAVDGCGNDGDDLELTESVRDARETCERRLWEYQKDWKKNKKQGKESKIISR